jgi:hypothetical protein
LGKQKKNKDTMETTAANVLSPTSRSDCHLNWVTRVPSPFPPGVVEHLPPDGRLHHQRSDHLDFLSPLSLPALFFIFAVDIFSIK